MKQEFGSMYNGVDRMRLRTAQPFKSLRTMPGCTEDWVDIEAVHQIVDTSVLPSWFYPVMDGDQAIGDFPVAYGEGRWQMVGYESGPTSVMLGHLVANWSAAGYHPVLIRLYHNAFDYEDMFTIPELGDDNLTPMTYPSRDEDPLWFMVSKDQERALETANARPFRPVPGAMYKKLKGRRETMKGYVDELKRRGKLQGKQTKEKARPEKKGKE